MLRHFQVFVPRYVLVSAVLGVTVILTGPRWIQLIDFL
jgi:hypothetical protein